MVISPVFFPIYFAPAGCSPDSPIFFIKMSAMNAFESRGGVKKKSRVTFRKAQWYVGAEIEWWECGQGEYADERGLRF